MKYSKKWLEEWIGASFTPEVLTDQLTMIGLEVDEVMPAAPEFSNVLVGETVTVEKHPSADKLKVCKVNVGGSDTLDIVCGAPNVRANKKYPVALVGAVLPKTAVKPATIRGVESLGMLCSGKELGLSEESGVIYELPYDADVGQDIREYLELDDFVINVDLTANRGDCASIRGIARDIAAFNRCEYLQPPRTIVTPMNEDVFSVVIKAPKACPHYVGRVVSSVNVNAVTPIWMQERLRRSGLHSLHPIVDVTNYVMLELGQPMHAFDLNKLSENVIVRFAESGEKLTLINGEEIKLDEKTLVIADALGPIALAGIMGGKRSAVSDGTIDIFLESAFFSVPVMARKARKYGLQTESSYRFEHGVDPELQVNAVERATQLLLDISGGHSGPIIEVREEDFIPKREPIHLNAAHIEKLIGLKISNSESLDTLKRLGMEIIQRTENEWQVTPPSFRFGIDVEENLIAEIARIHGYDNIPLTTAQTTFSIIAQDYSHEKMRRIRHLMQDRDYHEVITYSFNDSKLQKLYEPEEKALSLLNPIAKDMDVMRTSMLPNLVETLLFNLHHQQTRVRLFEIGTRFRYIDKKLIEENVIAGVIYGNIYSEQWGVKENRWVDFFDVKSDVEALLVLSDQINQMKFKSIKNHPIFHPAKSAALFLNEKCEGFLGLLHPRIAGEKGLKDVYLFEILLSPLLKYYKSVYKPISKFPSVRRDLAFTIDEFVSIESVKEEIQKITGDLLMNLIVFDVYHGEQIEEGKKSIAVGLVLQHLKQTLQVSDVDATINKIVKMLSDKFDAEIRT